MLKKTMDKVLRKKVREWVETIDDEFLREQVKNNVMISGGAITSMILNEDVNDYDVYIQDPEVLSKLSEYYANIYNKNHRRQVEVVQTRDEESKEITRVSCLIKSAGVAKEEEILTEEELPKYRPIYFTSNAITLSPIRS